MFCLYRMSISRGPSCLFPCSCWGCEDEKWRQSVRCLWWASWEIVRFFLVYEGERTRCFLS